MIENIIAILIINYINPADPSTIYPSGAKECDKYFNLPEPSKSPLLRLNIPIYDKDNNLIEPGIYEAELIEKDNLIILLKSREIIAKLPVAQIINLAQKNFIPTVNIQILDSKRVLIIYKNGNIEAHCFVAKPYF
ncbi:MAG: hypothetical protein V2B14_07245 [bacterium]